MKYKIIVDDKIVDATPELVAEMFAGMASDDQAQFFNHIAEIASQWSADICFQLQHITDDDGLTLAGRRVMSQIGEYSHWGLAPQHLS